MKLLWIYFKILWPLNFSNYKKLKEKVNFVYKKFKILVIYEYLTNIAYQQLIFDNFQCVFYCVKLIRF